MVRFSINVHHPLAFSYMYGSQEGQFSMQLTFHNVRAHKLWEVAGPHLVGLQLATVTTATSLFVSFNLACPLHVITVHSYNLIVIVLQ